jgi:GTP-binding protein
VDLPGYGFAKTSKKKKAIFQKMTEDYLLNRTNLICLFVLIDSRLKPQKIDQEFMQWLSEKEIPFVMIFTKSDKLGKIALEKNIQEYNTKMLKKWEELPKSFVTSAEKKTGLNEIIKYISSLNSKFKEI